MLAFLVLFFSIYCKSLLPALADPRQARLNSKQTPIPIFEESITGDYLGKVVEFKPTFASGAIT